MSFKHGVRKEFVDQLKTETRWIPKDAYQKQIKDSPQPNLKKKKLPILNTKEIERNPSTL